MCRERQILTRSALQTKGMMYMVCDGHLGVDAAHFVEDHFHRTLSSLLPSKLPDWDKLRGGSLMRSVGSVGFAREHALAVADVEVYADVVRKALCDTFVYVENQWLGIGHMAGKCMGACLGFAHGGTTHAGRHSTMHGAMHQAHMHGASCHAWCHASGTHAWCLQRGSCASPYPRTIGHSPIAGRPSGPACQAWGHALAPQHPRNGNDALIPMQQRFEIRCEQTPRRSDGWARAMAHAGQAGTLRQGQGQFIEAPPQCRPLPQTGTLGQKRGQIGEQPHPSQHSSDRRPLDAHTLRIVSNVPGSRL